MPATTGRTAVLHIGDQKAGSKTIQRLLVENEAAFRARGVARNHCFLHGDYHSGLRAVALTRTDSSQREMLEWGVGDDAAQAALKRRLDADLAAEIAALPTSIHTVAFSHEGLLFTDRAALERMREMLAPSFERFRIVAYIRRQDRAAVSRYSTQLRNGLEKSPRLPALMRLRGRVKLRHFDAPLAEWAAVFGEAAVRPRVFDRGAFVSGDLVDDFLTAAELGGPDGLIRPELRNESMNRPAQELLRQLHDHVPTVRDGGLNPDRKALAAMLSEVASGRGDTPSRLAAWLYYRRHARSNEEVRRRWFPERAQLFEGGFDDYPWIAPRRPSPDEVAPTLGALIALYGARATEARLDALLARAALALKTGRAETAAAAYRRACRLSPDAAAAWIGLAQAELALGAADQAAKALARAPAEDVPAQLLRRVETAQAAALRAN